MHNVLLLLLTSVDDSEKVVVTLEPLKITGMTLVSMLVMVVV